MLGFLNFTFAVSFSLAEYYSYCASRVAIVLERIKPFLASWTLLSERQIY
jgi:hypothetical protein